MFDCPARTNTFSGRAAAWPAPFISPIASAIATAFTLVACRFMQPLSRVVLG